MMDGTALIFRLGLLTSTFSWMVTAFTRFLIHELLAVSV